MDEVETMAEGEGAALEEVKRYPSLDPCEEKEVFEVKALYLSFSRGRQTVW